MLTVIARCWWLGLDSDLCWVLAFWFEFCCWFGCWFDYGFLLGGFTRCCVLWLVAFAYALRRFGVIVVWLLRLVLSVWGAGG